MLLSIAVAALFHRLQALTVCGYYDQVSDDFESELDRCYSLNVKGSRVRMAVEFEKCFGLGYATLNDTIAGPYRKKEKDTQDKLSHLSESLCSDNEDALNEFILRDDSQFEDEGVQADPGIAPSDFNIAKCQSFVGAVARAVTDQDFEVGQVMRQKEADLGFLFPKAETRQKIFQVVVNVVRPLASCHQPMEELKLRLIRKYLKRFLMDQISVSTPSFSSKTLPVVKHPELFVVQAASLSRTPEDAPINWSARPFHLLTAPPLKRVRVVRPLPFRPSETDMTRIAHMEGRNEGATLESEQQLLQRAIDQGQVTRTQALSMTPKQQLDSALIGAREYRKRVFRDERLGPGSPKVEVGNIWDDRLRLRKADFREDDFDRYDIKGFDIDKKIEELFSD